MIATAKLKFLHISPRKVRLVANLVRGKHFDTAVQHLGLLPKKGARPLLGLLKSAYANAKNKEGMDTDTLKVSKIWVDEGPTGKRFMPRAMGRATPVFKRTSHVTLMLEDSPSKSLPEAAKVISAKKNGIQKQCC